jgi:deoxyribonuclease-4
MPYLGAHLSIAGGFPRAVARAEATGCEALQIFTKSTGQWRARPIGDQEIRAFRDAVGRSRLRSCVAHANYLVNLASVDRVLRQRSTEALAEELDRADALGLDGLVFHPGSAADPDALHRVADAMGAILASRSSDALLLIEHTAGQGACLGHRFEHLATILDRLAWTPRVGICLDTCHLVAAGYELRTPRGYRETFRAFEAIVGLDRLKVMHVNDSKMPPGSRIDRHAHIGTGYVGLEGFTRLMNDRRFAGLPMVIETEKAGGRRTPPRDCDPLDVDNLSRLRGVMKRATAAARRRPPPRTGECAPLVSRRPSRGRP